MELMSALIDKLSDSHIDNETGVDTGIQKALGIILDDLVSKADDICASMVCSVDGVPWASKMDDGFDQNRFAAMSGALLALSDNLAQEADKGETNNVLIEGKKGNIFVLHATENLVMTVFTISNSNLGFSLAYARQAIETIAAVVESKD